MIEIPIVFVRSEDEQPVSGAEVAVRIKPTLLTSGINDTVTTDGHGRAIIANPGILYGGAIAYVDARKGGWLSKRSGSLQWGTNMWGTYIPNTQTIYLTKSGDLTETKDEKTGLAAILDEFQETMIIGGVLVGGIILWTILKR